MEDAINLNGEIMDKDNQQQEKPASNILPFDESINPETAQDNKALLYYWRGVRYMLEEEYGKALKDFRKSVELDPEYPLAHIACGRIHLLKGQASESRGLLSRAKST